MPQYYIYKQGSDKFRNGVRDGYYVTDIVLTVTGFAGAENTDWKCIDKVLGSIAAINGLPSSVVLSVISDVQINLSFSSTSTNQDGYRIYISTDNISFIEKGTSATTTFNATSLTAGTLYYFYVTAYKGTSESSGSSVVSATTWSAGEIIIRAGNTVGWYDWNDLTTITKDGSNLVSSWLDKLLSGHDLVQATGLKQPVWSADGITFDGAATNGDQLKTGTFTLNQPVMAYIVMKQVSWTSTDFVLDGYTDSTLILQQRTASPGLAIYGGTAYSSVNSNLAVGSYGLVRILWSGAASFLQINNTSKTTGSVGTAAGAGISIGSRAANLGCANIAFKEIIYRNVADNDGTQTSIVNYLNAKYGLF
jgi:hypothetical protein